MRSAMTSKNTSPDESGPKFEIDPKVAKQILRDIKINAVIQGIRTRQLKLEGATEDEKKQLVEDYLETFLANVMSRENPDEPLFIIYNHLNELLKEAREFVSKKNYELATLIYSTWFEHRVNDLVITGLQRSNTTESNIAQIVREVQIRGKLTWLLPLVGLPELDQSKIKPLLDLTEIRNRFVHYKWSEIDIDDFFDHRYTLQEMLIRAERAIEYLNSYSTLNELQISDEDVLLLFPEDEDED